MLQRCTVCDKAFNDFDHSTLCPHEYFTPNPYARGEIHATPTNVTQIAPAQRKVRLLHKNGLAFDFIVGKNFNLQATVTSIRANGFLLVPEGCYIPESEIGMIFMLQGEMTDKPAQVLQFPDNPVKP